MDVKKVRNILFLSFCFVFICNHSCFSECDYADSFDFPVLNKDLDDTNMWNVPSNRFGSYYDVMGGFHSGEDWNAVGTTSDADLGKPVRAIGNGQVIKTSELGTLGSLVAIKHIARPENTFYIKSDEGLQNNQSYSYSSEKVNSIYSVYIHLDNLEVDKNDCVKKGQIIGYIMDPCSNKVCPHLHFEIRHPETISSSNWSLSGEMSNWIKVDGEYTGYYINLQKMVDCGFRNPTDFIKENKAVKSSDELREFKIQKAGLYHNSNELKKTSFTFSKRPTHFYIHHHADGDYFINSESNKILHNNQLTLYLVPNRPISLGGFDEMNGTIFEVKRNIHIYKVQNNLKFLTVFDGVKQGDQVDFSVSTLSDTLQLYASGLARQRKQLLKIDLDLPVGKYIIFEGEGNVYDEEVYPEEDQGCWYIEIVAQSND